MLFIIDQLILSFLYVNVLTSQFTIMGIPISKAIILTALFFYIIYLLRSPQNALSRRFCIYIFFVIFFMTMLTLISIMQYNDLSNVMQFLSPFSILLTIPLFSSLYTAFGIERYLRHLLFAIVILAATTTVFYFLTVEHRDIASMINLYSNNFQITYPDFGSRILSKTGVFFPSGLILSLYFLLRERKIRYGLSFAIIAFALYHHHTFTVIIAGLISLYLFLIIFDKPPARKKAIAAIGICAVVFIGAVYLSGTYAHKRQSVDIKVQQMYKAVDIFSESPIAGQGLGFLFSDMDDRLTDTLMLEVSFMTILASSCIGVLV